MEDCWKCSFLLYIYLYGCCWICNSVCWFSFLCLKWEVHPQPGDFYVCSRFPALTWQHAHALHPAVGQLHADFRGSFLVDKLFPVKGLFSASKLCAHVHVRACICALACVCDCVCACVCVWLCVHACLCVCTMCAYMHASVYVCTCSVIWIITLTVCASMCMCTCMHYVCIHACKCVCVWLHLFTYLDNYTDSDYTVLRCRCLDILLKLTQSLQKVRILVGVHWFLHLCSNIRLTIVCPMKQWVRLCPHGCMQA